MRHIFFFATPADIRPVLGRFERHEALKFIETGKRNTPDRPIYLSSSMLPNPGIATAESAGFCTTYMVSRRDTKNVMYRFRNEAGEQRWLLSNGDNDETVLLTLAGIANTGTLLPGKINTLHQTPVAQHLMRLFMSSLRQENFKKVETWWLGREAFEMLTAGRRLSTTSEKSPPEFDLKLPTSLVE